jgi:hypothetical protein
MAGTWKEVARSVLRGAPKVLRQLRRPTPAASRPAPSRPHATSPADVAARVNGGAPGAHTAPAGRHLEYVPKLDGQADPGEIVWTWVKYEDDPDQGKDRPVLVVGRQGKKLLGLMLSSQSERDGQRNWLALGEGGWDSEKRPSWIRLDRVIEVDEDGIRREGSILDRHRFDQVAGQLRAHYGWA